VIELVVVFVLHLGCVRVRGSERPYSGRMDPRLVVEVISYCFFDLVSGGSSGRMGWDMCDVKKTCIYICGRTTVWCPKWLVEDRIGKLDAA
jgi:hypothetical protein